MNIIILKYKNLRKHTKFWKKHKALRIAKEMPLIKSKEDKIFCRKYKY
jgi:hypothetical protein